MADQSKTIGAVFPPDNRPITVNVLVGVAHGLQPCQHKPFGPDSTVVQGIIAQPGFGHELSATYTFEFLKRIYGSDSFEDFWCIMVSPAMPELIEALDTEGSNGSVVSTFKEKVAVYIARHLDLRAGARLTLRIGIPEGGVTVVQPGADFLHGAIEPSIGVWARFRNFFFQGSPLRVQLLENPWLDNQKVEEILALLRTQGRRIAYRIARHPLIEGRLEKAEIVLALPDDTQLDVGKASWEEKKNRRIAGGGATSYATDIVPTVGVLGQKKK